jgi:6-pyruvoyltetrahydropterin/6-carboxytetrahydropterin synthase
MAAMQETFTEFTFDAAHKTTPTVPLHGHTFRATLFLTGERHPEFGWSHDLDGVHLIVQGLKNQLDHCYLNEIPGLELPTLENVTRWVWEYLAHRIPGLDRVVVQRGAAGYAEGCVYRGAN